MNWLYISAFIISIILGYYYLKSLTYYKRSYMYDNQTKPSKKSKVYYGISASTTRNPPSRTTCYSMDGQMTCEVE
jgi:hypothetical protein